MWNILILNKEYFLIANEISFGRDVYKIWCLWAINKLHELVLLLVCTSPPTNIYLCHVVLQKIGLQNNRFFSYKYYWQTDLFELHLYRRPQHDLNTLCLLRCRNERTWRHMNYLSLFPHHRGYVLTVSNLIHRTMFPRIIITCFPFRNKLKKTKPFWTWNRVEVAYGVLKFQV